MAHISRFWLVFLVCMTASGSVTACIRKLGRAIDGGMEPGIIPLVGRIMRGLLNAGNTSTNYGYGVGGSFPGNQYGLYPGLNQGGYSTYNQQPLGSTYYPNQLLGSNIQTQPVQPYYSGQPAVQTNLSPQPLVTGTPYQPATTTVQTQPAIATPVVQAAGNPPRYIRR